MQVCLRWMLEKDCVMATGTGSDPATVGTYAKEDLDIYSFNLTASEVAKLDALGVGKQR